jgi:hypothetical protein
MSNPFGCPNNLFDLMMSEDAPVHFPMLHAIRVLGPNRVQYAPLTKKGAGIALANWLLDGKRATDLALIRAAKIPQPKWDKPTKLGAEGAQEIRRRAAAGEKVKDLAAAFDCTSGHICNVLSGRIWKEQA